MSNHYCEVCGDEADAYCSCLLDMRLADSYAAGHAAGMAEGLVLGALSREPRCETCCYYAEALLVVAERRREAQERAVSAARQILGEHDLRRRLRAVRVGASNAHENAIRVLRAARGRGPGIRSFGTCLSVETVTSRLYGQRIGWVLHETVIPRDTARIILRGLLAPEIER
jgi:hypothetical protein